MEPYTKNSSIVARYDHSYVRKVDYPFDRQRRSVLFAVTRTLDGFKNPRYKQQIAAMDNATTTMSGVYTIVDSQPGWAQLGCRWDPINGYNSQQFCVMDWKGHLAAFNHGSTLTDPLYSGNAEPKARLKVYKEIRDIQTQVSGLTFLGELRESIRMIRRPLARLQETIKDWEATVKKLKRYRPRDWTHQLSSAWLEKSFGWDPLLNDIDGAFDAYDLSVFRPTRVRFRCVGVDGKLDNTLSATTLGSATSVENNLWVNNFRKRYDRHVYVYRGAVKTQAEHDTTSYVTSVGFHAKEWLPTAWELLPWSFLVDYFASIGDVLEATVTNKSALAWISGSSIKTRTTDWVVAPNFGLMRSSVPAHSFIGVAGQPSSIRTVRTLVARNSSVDLEPPELVFRYPDPGTEGGAFKLLNMAALLNEFRGVHRQRNPPKWHKPPRKIRT